LITASKKIKWRRNFSLNSGFWMTAIEARAVTRA